MNQQPNSNSKELLTTDEAARYLGVKKSYLYKLMNRGAIPYYKPWGKKCYFKLSEIEGCLQSNRVSTEQEITDRANKILMEKGGIS